MKRKNKLISYVLLACVSAILGIFFVSPITHANTPLVCNMSTVTGDDDGSFPMTLPFSLKLGSTEYNQIFYSTNATVTFGQPDGTYWDYPQTPSVSVAGKDWVSFGEGAYTSYGYNNDSFCIEWSVRPFPQSSGPLTQMRLVVNKFPNGNWHGEIVTMTQLPPDARRAIRYEYGQPVVTMAAAFDVGNAGVPVEVSAAPTPPSFTQPPVIVTPSPTPTPTPSPSITPEPSPTATLAPQPSVSPEPTVEPSPQPLQPSPEPSEPAVQPSETFSPSPTPSESELVVPEPQPSQSLSPEPEPSSPSEPTPSPEESLTPDPNPEATDLPFNNNNIDGLTAEEEAALNELLTEYGPMDAISFEDFEASGLDYEDLPPDQPVMLDNGVILTAEVADAIEMFEDPSELLLTVFTDPGKALKAFANVGADMTPEERKESQAVVVASVIVGQLIASTNLITGRIR